MFGQQLYNVKDYKSFPCGNRHIHLFFLFWNLTQLVFKFHPTPLLGVDMLTACMITASLMLSCLCASKGNKTQNQSAISHSQDLPLSTEFQELVKQLNFLSLGKWVEQWDLQRHNTVETSAVKRTGRGAECGWDWGGGHHAPRLLSRNSSPPESPRHDSFLGFINQINTSLWDSQFTQN